MNKSDISKSDSVVPEVEIVLKEGQHSRLIKKQDEERPATYSPYGEMGLEVKRTVNLGNCNSGMVRISLSLPVLPQRKNIDKMCDWLVMYVKKRLRRELDEMEEEGWDWPRKNREKGEVL